MGSRVHVCPRESPVELLGSRAAEFSRQRKFITARIPQADNKTALWCEFTSGIIQRLLPSSFEEYLALVMRRTILNKNLPPLLQLPSPASGKSNVALRPTDDKTFVLSDDFKIVHHYYYSPFCRAVYADWFFSIRVKTVFYFQSHLDISSLVEKKISIYYFKMFKIRSKFSNINYF